MPTTNDRQLLLDCIMGLDRDVRLRVGQDLGLLPPDLQRLRETRLQRALAASPVISFAKLNKHDLVALLKRVEFRLAGRYLRFDDNLPRLSKSTLVQLAERVFLTSWAPTRLDQTVRIGGEVIRFSVTEIEDGEDEYDDEEDEYDDEEDDQDEYDDEEDEYDDEEDDDEHAARYSRLPNFERLSTRPIDAQPHLAVSHLAPFQRKALEALDKHFVEPGRRGVLQLPTGGGKTRTAVHWVVTRHLARSRRVLWVAPRRELLDQAHDELRRQAVVLAKARPDGLTIGRWTEDAPPTTDVVLVTSSLFARRRERVALAFSKLPVDLVVFDEAHRAPARKTHQTLRRLLRASSPSLLGLTATPWRGVGDKVHGIERSFGPTVVSLSFSDLVRQGFLARPRIFVHRLVDSPAVVFSPEELQYIEKYRDVPPSVLLRLAMSQRRDDEIVSHWLRRRRFYGKTIAFACNKDHCRSLAERFASRGVRASWIDSDLERDERARRLEQFKRNELELLVNVEILTEGVDVPDTQTVLLARPTLSARLYLQMIGRAARGPSAVAGKEHFNVVDHVDNFGQHQSALVGMRLGQDPYCDDGKVSDDAEFEELREIAEVVDEAPPSEIAGDDSLDSDSPENLVLPKSLSRFLLTKLMRWHEFHWWGELHWKTADGVERAHPVFAETLQLVQTALVRIKQALERDWWKDAYALTTTLVESGALAEDAWYAMLADCRETGEPPRLVPSPNPHATTEAMAKVARIARELEHASISTVGRALASHWHAPENGSLRRVWPTVESFVRAVVQAMSIRTGP